MQTVMEAKTLSVSAIKNGTVIDHISPGNALRIVDLLMAVAAKRQITIGLNLSSPSMHLKDLIKLEDKVLTEQEVNQVSIFAPLATISIIQNYEVVRKFKVSIPEVLEHSHLRCPNPTCITNSEKIPTYFAVLKQINNMKLQCKYCEKTFSQSEMALLHNS